MSENIKYRDFSTITSVAPARRAKLLKGIDLAVTQGVEIGALCRPFVKRCEGHVIYVDHANTDTLKSKYKQASDVDIDCLVDVDAVWGEKGLHDAVGGHLVDWVIASHVIEHVPDLITWLRELASVLKTNGEVRLIIPDKRYTFDYLRQTTRLADVMLSYIKQARVPQAHCILDFALNAAKVDGMAAWAGELQRDNLELHNTWQQALMLAMDAENNNSYHDIHCWAFTPASFANLMEQICSMGLIDFSCEDFSTTLKGESEFFVTLRRSHDQAFIRDSWREMRRIASDPDATSREWKSRRKTGQSDALDPSQPFTFSRTLNPHTYLAANADVARSGMDPILHYLIYGWLEGRRTSHQQ